MTTPISRWIYECCTDLDNHKTKSSVLFKSWKTWAELNGEFAGSINKFSRDLQSCGYKHWRLSGETGLSGITLKPDARISHDKKYSRLAG